ncbi:MAG: DNA alkylation repair protein [Candidatus Pacebacteria bacterium]|jgi:3-methyladenine DNA glycosylase AlkD|nr:DNA alkylation repair protein [Candidatus Paceibacterota bacterium]MBT4652292.1 DNA alkylation repair protein [Candidatus Paceibacterota bacterium]MBT6756485.1 DNA alkylation repair protein [Candidatus Paceibacterota bacterium]MBT6921458.1 DNA alkylation repair protein [Candidatus Paceibacterota bacterium]
MKIKSSQIINELNSLKDPEKAQILQRFFKTGKGQYAEGDIFWGITVPKQRSIAQKYKLLELSEVKKLVKSPIHEIRLTGFLLLTYQYLLVSDERKKEIFEFYFNHRKYVNNWDLVDVTTPKIIGEYIKHNPKKQKLVFSLITSKNLWERRIALLATHPFIKSDNFKDILSLATKVLDDPHDLIHKASGWMLREMGKRDTAPLIKFLDQYTTQMPRTMLRYSIERLPEKTRKKYLTKK